MDPEQNKGWPFRPVNWLHVSLITLAYSSAAVGLIAWTQSGNLCAVITVITCAFGPAGIYACRTFSDLPRFFGLFYIHRCSIPRYFCANIFAFLLIALGLITLRLFVL